MTDKSLAEIADRLLTFMFLCEDETHRIAVSLKSMDGAIPLDDGAGFDARSLERHEFLIPFNSGAPAVWPVDTKIVMDEDRRDYPENDRWPAGTLGFYRTRTISTKDARLLGATRYSPKMVMNEMVAALPDGKTKSGGGPYALLGSKWIPAAPKAIQYPPGRHDAIGVALGFSLAVRYEWTVWLGYADGPRIRFLSDPYGACEVFRLRDIPEGRQRRAALRHWVTQHWRKKRHDAEARSWIERHLRGTVDFTWNGLRCRIQPSEFEIEEIAARKRSE